MSVGRRGDKTYTGHNGVATNRLRGLDKLRTPGSGVDGRVAPPSQEALRKFIVAQICPWCGSGPFKSLAVHTSKTHGVPAAELRELAGMTRHAPLCDPEYSATRADMRKGVRLPGVAYERNKGPGRVYSEAGKNAQRAKSAKQPQEARVAAARVIGDRTLAANAAKHARICEMYEAGEPMAVIAREVGVSKPTVIRTLKREGLYEDGRTRRWR